MRGKRSKQYRKLMQQYGLSFGFREPYQVLVDADIIRDTERFKMDLTGGLERTLHGKVKPMITQCCMRHLYASVSKPGNSYVIDKAKMFERRRCGHRPEEYPNPLSAVECISSVVDPKGSKTNKHRYVVASQELDVRKAMRGILGVPLVYINRSIMIMEPMAGVTAENREREERAKFRVGLKNGRSSGSQGTKRKREDGDDGVEETVAKRKRSYEKGPKGPNPLAVKKSKKRVEGGGFQASSRADSKAQIGRLVENAHMDTALGTGIKRKRRRKHKSVAGEGSTVATAEDHYVSAEA